MYIEKLIRAAIRDRKKRAMADAILAEARKNPDVAQLFEYFKHYNPAFLDRVLSSIDTSSQLQYALEHLWAIREVDRAAISNGDNIGVRDPAVFDTKSFNRIFDASLIHLMETLPQDIQDRLDYTDTLPVTDPLADVSKKRRGKKLPDPSASIPTPKDTLETASEPLYSEAAAGWSDLLQDDTEEGMRTGSRDLSPEDKAFKESIRESEEILGKLPFERAQSLFFEPPPPSKKPSVMIGEAPAFYENMVISNPTLLHADLVQSDYERRTNLRRPAGVPGNYEALLARVESDDKNHIIWYDPARATPSQIYRAMEVYDPLNEDKVPDMLGTPNALSHDERYRRRDEANRKQNWGTSQPSMSSLPASASQPRQPISIPANANLDDVSRSIPASGMNESDRMDAWSQLLAESRRRSDERIAANKSQPTGGRNTVRQQPPVGFSGGAIPVAPAGTFGGYNEVADASGYGRGAQSGQINWGEHPHWQGKDYQVSANGDNANWQHQYGQPQQSQPPMRPLPKPKSPRITPNIHAPNPYPGSSNTYSRINRY
jgi:hypothetical protein